MAEVAGNDPALVLPRPRFSKPAPYLSVKLPFRGHNRIQTCVLCFADKCLITRPYAHYRCLLGFEPNPTRSQPVMLTINTINTAEEIGLEPTHQFPDTGFQDRGDTNYALSFRINVLGDRIELPF